MRVDRPHSAVAAVAQPLTEELLLRSGITPGMRVVVLGSEVADVALLVAERVGTSGAVIGFDESPGAVADARRRVLEERFGNVTFRVGALDDVSAEPIFDAAIGRFFLMHQRDPVAAIRRTAAVVHGGGRLVFQEWHYASVLWTETSDWPCVPLYRKFARSSIETLRRQGRHVDMGLRLPNAFTSAGLPAPSIRTDLRIVQAPCTHGYRFFESEMRRLLPGTQHFRIANDEEVDIASFAESMQREAAACDGHVFLPLQVGAWTRVPAALATASK